MERGSEQEEEGGRELVRRTRAGRERIREEEERGRKIVRRRIGRKEGER
jgi:hypothetical protein